MLKSHRNPFSLHEETLKEIEIKFALKKELAAGRNGELFDVFDDSLTEEEAVALKFLYAYMPLSDLANYEGALFLRHVRATLRIRQQTAWGMQIPDSVFLYFVLPYRVNNENIEDIREMLFEELYPRVKGLSMTEAVLETNHWCHEKANYAGNDMRTASPLTLIRTALGRCGEQSTLAVAALRSIGIPARQVYTPRWAHCDSNHAWVEAWTDGKWHFLGACEPEPVLDQGWFRKPARRAMLVHTRVPSRYAGEEKVTFSRSWLSELNLLDHYAPNRTIAVQVQDEEGKPVQAKVDFQLYNFAELSTIVTLDTNEQGEATIDLGMGDVWIHAYNPEGHGYAKLNAALEAQAVIPLSPGESASVLDFAMTPPAELPDFRDDISPELIEANQKRVQEGARIRSSYEATFLQEQQAAELASQLGLPASAVWEVLRKARGNSHEIARFLSERTPSHGMWPLKLLESLRDKDLTDTFIPVLDDHLLHALPLKEQFDEQAFTEYVMCPRLHFEMLEPYRSFFRSELPAERQAACRARPQQLAEWIDSWFEVVEEYNFYKGMATPRGSYLLKKGDTLSRDIMFAAIARSIGIAARLEPGDQRPQYWHGGAWIDAFFHGSSLAASSQAQPASGSTGSIQLRQAPDSDEQAKYYHNFTLARLIEGRYVTLSYAFGSTDMLEQPLEALVGQYRLTTGTRQSDGTALVRMHHFTVEAGQTAEIAVLFSKAEADIPVIASMPSGMILERFNGSAAQLEEAVKQGGAVLAWIEPDREPSKHLLRELRELSGELNKLPAPIYLLVGEEKRAEGIALPSLTELPVAACFCKDDGAYSQLDALTRVLPEDAAVDRSFPIVAVLDAAMDIRYISSGYKLGIGKEVLKTLKHI
ncbi:transglutaminase-like domain-containing protein [Paenibacillus sp. J5C_2022]|uniref:transglutaminase-like domain-containing protein n=1 Tax=Paenibacillus sp. J5C2022 TaxID=2977129 RepID=UPI0021D2C37A|nr:transglutaminase-like domain-containing protein [Paenibacillus sp. J5C2022]MCU6712336.1 transglutaminase-like domain-containing protein [Paenibacillus sp. J5C2022]